MIEYGVAVLRVILDSRPHTAPHRVEGRTVGLEVAGAEGIEVAHSAALGILGAQDVVVEGTLVVVHVAGVGFPAEQLPGQLQHVVSDARFGAVPVQVLGLFAGSLEVLVEVDPARRKRAGADHRVPEETGHRGVALLAGQFVEAGCPDDLGHLGVDMLARQLVALRSQRSEDALVVEALRQCQVILVASHGREPGHRVAHPSVLALQHLLKLRVAQLVGSGLGPVRELAGHLEGLLVAGQLEGVEQAGEGLVQDVPGDVSACQSPLVDPKFPGKSLVPHLRPHRSGVAVPMLGLRLRDFRNHVVDPPLQTRVLVADARRLQRERREIVSRHAPHHVLLLPTPVALPLHRQAGPLMEGPEHAIGVKFAQVLQVDLARFEKGTVREKGDLVQRKGLGGAHYFGGLSCTGQRSGDDPNRQG